ncbi:hypothetical protein LCGC14_1256080 [marine sediment metagenome]|uniref:Uncharacterized protein n=1 Tax=marine sediment metagenome TaxID=412755 RepID=A0A0F9L4V4_9ZZZZ
MSIKVKSGTPAGVHRDIPGTSGKDDVREFDESEKRSRPTDVTELRGKGKNGRDVVGVLDERSPTQIDQDANRDRRRQRRRGLNVDSGSRVEMEERRELGKGDVTIEVGSTEIFKTHPTTRKPGHAAERVYVDDRIYTDKRAGTFLKRMEEGFSAEETNQGNPFGPPAAGSTKPRTFSEAMQELVFRFRLLMVEVFLPEDYEVVQVAPQRFLRDFLMEARELWQSYEPLLGRRIKSDSILQVEAPPEEDE